MRRSFAHLLGAYQPEGVDDLNDDPNESIDTTAVYSTSKLSRENLFEKLRFNFVKLIKKKIFHVFHDIQHDKI